MELLIAGVIAIAGYGLATERRRPDLRPSYAPGLGNPGEYPGAPVDTRKFDRDHERLSRQRWQAAMQPSASGVVTPLTAQAGASLMPFFRSARSQNTNDAVKQTRMEMFTGATDMSTSATGTYRRKHEVESMFAPVSEGTPVTSGGTVGTRAAERFDTRYEPGVVHNNVQPMEQVRVGRGVGVGPDVQAADGFHPMYRVLLKNVNEHRKNNLPGRVNPGFHPISKRTTPVPVAVSDTKSPGSLVFDASSRMMPTEAAVKAHAVYPSEPHGTLRGPKPMAERTGNPAMPGTILGRVPCSTLMETRIGYEARDNPDRNIRLPWLNAGASSTGVGGFTHANFEVRDQQREAVGREGFVTGPSAAGHLPSGHVLPATQRESLRTAPVGGIGVIRSSGAARASDEFRATHRQAANERSAPLLGTKAAVQGGALDNVWRYKRLMRTAKRAGQDRGYTPGAGRVNVHDPRAMGSVALRNHAAQAVATPLPTMGVPRYQESLGRSAVVNNKLPTHNPRLDLGMAREQLRGNPYVHSLSEA